LKSSGPRLDIALACQRIVGDREFDRLQAFQFVAKAGGLLEVEIGGGGAHAFFEIGDRRLGARQDDEGGIAGQLIGGPPRASLDGGKTIANFYPYATTIFDYVRRAMPYTQPRSLTDQEVYALTAYLLARNKLIGENDAMNAETLPKVKMPNRDNFVTRFPDRI